MSGYDSEAFLRAGIVHPGHAKQIEPTDTSARAIAGPPQIILVQNWFEEFTRLVPTA